MKHLLSRIILRCFGTPARRAQKYYAKACAYGKDKNHSEAAKWYRKAADEGHAQAQSDLGECYYFGEGVEQNYAEAVKWYRKAAEQGHEQAQDALENYYGNCENVPQDYIEATKWWRDQLNGTKHCPSLPEANTQKTSLGLRRPAKQAFELCSLCPAKNGCYTRNHFDYNV